MYEDWGLDGGTEVRPRQIGAPFGETGEADPGEVQDLEALVWAGELDHPDPEPVRSARPAGQPAGFPDFAYAAAGRLKLVSATGPDTAPPRAPGRPVELPDASGPAQPHRAAVALNALGDAARLEVFRLVATEGRDGLSPEAVAGALEIGRRDALKHLSILRRARLVQEIRHNRGKSIFVANNWAARDCLTFIHELAGLLRAA